VFQGRGPNAASLGVVVAIIGGSFAGWNLPNFNLTAAPPLPPDPETSTETSTDVPELKQALRDLENELERLQAASSQIDRRATELLGPSKEGQGRIPKLPKSQADLVEYLKRCLALVETVEDSFGDLVAAKDQVDLKERIPEAREHVKRIENAGAAGMLARRQVRAWIEKDLQAVESLNADWPAIRKSVESLIKDGKRFESGEISIDKVTANHRVVLESCATRTRFHHSRLARLCRQAADAADQLHRKRLAQPTVAMHLSSGSGLSLPESR
jgi:chromosome segregation ATPase